MEDILNADGCVSLRIFLEWFIAEEVSDSIHAYMQKEFPSKHKFLERSSLITFRFRIFPYEIGDGTGSGTVEASNTVLADVFSKFESSKERLRIQEYSVGQTTLEQIFNQFAAGQDNPVPAAAGIAQAMRQHLGSLTNFCAAIDEGAGDYQLVKRRRAESP